MNFEKFSQGYYIFDVGKSKLIVKGDVANSPKMYDFIGFYRIIESKLVVHL